MSFPDTARTCPLVSITIASTPARVRHAVTKLWRPSTGRVWRLITGRQPRRAAVATDAVRGCHRGGLAERVRDIVSGHEAAAIVLACLAALLAVEAVVVLAWALAS